VGLQLRKKQLIEKVCERVECARGGYPPQHNSASLVLRLHKMRDDCCAPMTNSSIEGGSSILNGIDLIFAESERWEL
jgi:hypothetical protein